MLSDTLRELREGAGLSQLDLARLSGVDRTVIWRIETEECLSPAIQTVFCLARALGCSLDELVTGVRFASQAQRDAAAMLRQLENPSE